MQKPLKRWLNGKGYRGQYFETAINKYGWNNIKHEIIYDNLTKEEAEAKEREMIAFYNSDNKEYGYNILEGGLTNKRYPEEVRLKISESRIGNKNPFYGKKHTKESIRKMIESRTGLKRNDNTKQKISEWHKNNQFGGRNPSAKKIKCITTDEEFNCIKDALDKYLIDRKQMYKHLHNKCNYAGNDNGIQLKWKYID